MGEDLEYGWACAASRQQGPLVPRETLLGFKLTTGPVPENRSSLLIAYRVTQGKVGISIERLWMGEPLTPRPLIFTTSNIVEFVHLLDQLEWPSKAQAHP